MDRRISQITQIGSTTQANCIHTKNVFSMVDLSHHDDSFIRMKRHIDNCSVCEREYEKFTLENLAVKIHIPKPQIDTETKELFSREISELFKTFDLNHNAQMRKKITNKIKTIDTFGAGVLKGLTSKTMLASYAFGLVLFVVLKQYFN